MTFDSEEALLAAMAAELPGLVESYVKPKGESLLRHNIVSGVYDAYTPVQYSRRGTLTRDIISDIIKTGVYSVDYEVTSASDPAPPAIGWVYRKGGFLAMLEGGNMGFWRNGFPRPSLSTTQSQFDRGYLSNAIREGIKAVF